MLDSGSSIDIFINNKIVTYIKRINQVLHLYTNVVSKINQIQEMVSEYGKVWYDDKDRANIFSFENLFKKYRVTKNSHKDYFFTVHTKIGIIKFERNE